MIHNFQSAIDTIFPPSPDHRHLRGHTATTFIVHYSLTKVGDTWALSHYLNHTIKAAIKECKYRNNRNATSLLASLLTTWLTTQPNVPTLLIPIPLSRARLRNRGYNQVAQVCRALPYMSHVTVAPKFLVRSRDTVPQTSLNRNARLTNMQEAFIVPSSSLAQLAKYEHIIICDDVLTTGATLAAARAAIFIHQSSNTTLTTVAWAH